MPLYRTIDRNTFNAAVRDLRPAARPVGFLAAQAIETARLQRLSREADAQPLSTADGFDHSAIMRAAIAAARVERAKGSALSWTALLASALRFTWARAKAARRAGLC